MSQLGYHLISNFQRSELRESMREALETGSAKKDMRVIVFEENAAAIRWEDEGNEFYLDGKLYDVSSIEKQNGKTLIHCVCDEDESELVDNVAKTVAAVNDKATGKESKHVVKFRLSDYTVHSIYRTPHAIITPSTEYVDFDVAIYPSLHAVDTDPPRC